jgi:manganese-dependent inorganic pyrophosphatase
MNTLDVVGFSSTKGKMLDYMNDKLLKEHYDILLLLLTNIIDEGSLFISIGKNDLIEKAFNIKLNNNEAYVPGILSRKKQVVPILSRCLSNSGV